MKLQHVDLILNSDIYDVCPTKVDLFIFSTSLCFQPIQSLFFSTAFCLQHHFLFAIGIILFIQHLISNTTFSIQWISPFNVYIAGSFLDLFAHYKMENEAKKFLLESVTVLLILLINLPVQRYFNRLPNSNRIRLSARSASNLHRFQWVHRWTLLVKHPTFY